MHAVERAAVVSAFRAVLTHGQTPSPTLTVHAQAPVRAALGIVHTNGILGVAESLDAVLTVATQGAAISGHGAGLTQPGTTCCRDTQKLTCNA